jgi:hypothetical protein
MPSAAGAAISTRGASRARPQRSRLADGDSLSADRVCERDLKPTASLAFLIEQALRAVDSVTLALELRG